MGAGASKEEQLFLAVQKGDLRSVVELRRQGANLEFRDSKGRTPLTLTCCHPEGLETARTLLQIGASIRAYRHGPEGGFPIHHAARRGLDRTVDLLMQYGADPLYPNDLGLTALDLARAAGAITTVRLIEDRVCLYSGLVRQQVMSGPSIIKAFASNWVYKSIWVSVLPGTTNPNRPAIFELAAYASVKVAMPFCVIKLLNVEMHASKSNSEPSILVSDPTNKLKLLADKDTNDPQQLQKLYNACKGVPQKGMYQPLPNQAGASTPSAPPPPNPIQPVNPLSSTSTPPLPNDYGGWGAGSVQSTNYGGWGPQPSADQASAPPATSSSSSTVPPVQLPPYPTPSSIPATLYESHSIATAPPLPESLEEEALSLAPPDLSAPAYPSLYPSIDSTPLVNPVTGQVNTLQAATAPPVSSEPAASSPNGKNVNSDASDKTGGNMCVVCWDNPAVGVCVPCGHQAGCMDCLNEIKEKKWGCPVCRTPIDQIVKVFQV